MIEDFHYPSFKIPSNTNFIAWKCYKIPSNTYASLPQSNLQTKMKNK